MPPNWIRINCVSLNYSLLKCSLGLKHKMQKLSSAVVMINNEVGHVQYQNNWASLCCGPVLLFLLLLLLFLMLSCLHGSGKNILFGMHFWDWGCGHPLTVHKMSEQINSWNILCLGVIKPAWRFMSVSWKHDLNNRDKNRTTFTSGTWAAQWRLQHYRFS